MRWEATLRTMPLRHRNQNQTTPISGTGITSSQPMCWGIAIVTCRSTTPWTANDLTESKSCTDTIKRTTVPARLSTTPMTAPPDECSPLRPHKKATPMNKTFIMHTHTHFDFIGDEGRVLGWLRLCDADRKLWFDYAFEREFDSCALLLAGQRSFHSRFQSGTVTLEWYISNDRCTVPTWSYLGRTSCCGIRHHHDAGGAGGTSKIQQQIQPPTDNRLKLTMIIADHYHQTLSG